MTLFIKVESDKIAIKLLKNGRVLDPVKPHRGHGVLGRDRQRRFYVLDSETFSYYHDISEKLTPLEVSAIKRKGFIKRGKTVIYGELLTGLITSLDKLLKRNNIDTTALNSFKIRGNTGKNSTSYKIAAAFIEGLRAGV